MKWLKRKLRNWINEDYPVEITESSYGTISLNTKTFSSEGFRIQVYRANGGIVLETSVYDRHKDCNHNGLYVVTEDEQLGETIAKIITMESLKS